MMVRARHIFGKGGTWLLNLDVNILGVSKNAKRI